MAAHTFLPPAPTSARLPEEPALAARFLAFIVERAPLALTAARAAVAELVSESHLTSARVTQIGPEIARRVSSSVPLDRLDEIPETTPFVSARERMAQAQASLTQDVAGFFEREAIRLSLTADELRGMLRGIVLTRAVDNRLKQLFLSSEMKFEGQGIQGKGFRSLGQEAIFASALRLRKGAAAVEAGAYVGDVVAPLIRDLGVFLAFTDDVERAINAQVGKDAPPMSGKDLHYGDVSRGVLPAAAPLTISTCTAVGAGLAFAIKREPRVAVSFIGEGGSSLGEWHEAINFAAARHLPVVFCLQNNQTALSTPVLLQSHARVFADKALGYGIPGVTLDGTDPEAIAAAFAWGADRARMGGGPVLLELVAMRMCGHAHHDDMLYLGSDPPLSFALPPPPQKGYVDAEKWRAWSARDPLARFATSLFARGLATEDDLARMQRDAVERCEEAVRALHGRPWPSARSAGVGVFGDEPPRVHPAPVAIPTWASGPLPERAIEPAPPFDPKGSTLLEAVALGTSAALDRLPHAFVLGEDVGPPYGNAFLLLRTLVEKHGDRLWNTPIAEAAILGAATGAALFGMRPIAEMQFNDFVATGMNELVNNAAKLRWRTGSPVPLVVRMPWGGLRRAGPYHSQDTSPWFARAFGLKIVVPSTPHDARALLLAAVEDDDPVLFYEHIALYRDPRIKQRLDDEVTPMPLGRAAFRRLGDDLTILSYGAFVHRALACAARLEQEAGFTCDVVDLRSLAPLDAGSIEASVRHTGKVLLVGEDSRTGSILESIASRISEALYLHLDGPVRVLGALDTPVPYAPSLEDAYLVSETQLFSTARALAEF